jgi:hypothetical protein
MTNGDIVTVLTVAGEFIGKLAHKDGDSVTLDDPRMLIHNEQGMGFAHGVCVTGEREPKSVEFMGVVLITPTADEVAKAWRQATSGIITA